MSNGVVYTQIDLNATGTTTIYDPEHDATVQGVHLENAGSSADVHLEVTDGTTTVDLTTAQTAGDAIRYVDPTPLDSDNLLQVNVLSAEGSSLTSDAAVLVD